MAQIVSKRKIAVTVTTAGTAVPISTTKIFTPDITLFGLAANAGASFYVGDSTVDNTWIPRAKSNMWSLVHGSGELTGTAGLSGEFDLSKMYIDSDSNGDVVIVEYLVRETL